MASQAYEQLALLGGEMGTYTTSAGVTKRVLGLVDPVRRTDQLGNQSFLTKTYELWFVRSTSEGIMSIKEGFDTFAVKLLPSDTTETALRITKILPERDFGNPGDGVGMWHVEAVR